MFCEIGKTVLTIGSFRFYGCIGNLIESNSALFQIMQPWTEAPTAEPLRPFLFF